MGISQVKSPVLPREVNCFIELLLNKYAIIGYKGDADYGHEFALLGGDFRDREIEPALQSADKTFNDLTFVLQRSDPMKIHLNCQSTNKHFASRSWMKLFVNAFQPFVVYMRIYLRCR